MGQLLSWRKPPWSGAGLGRLALLGDSTCCLSALHRGLPREVVTRRRNFAEEQGGSSVQKETLHPWPA